MTLTRSGIPTTYRHTEFRSRLEARWAAFFDLVGWSWVYEPVDADGYIPDFLIKGDRPFYVEVGPCVTRDDYVAKSAKAAANAAVLRQEVLVLGVDPLPRIRAEGSGNIVAGLLGEFYPACGDGRRHDDYLVDDRHTCSAGYWFENAVWAGPADAIGIYHCFGSYAHRPWGGHEWPLGDPWTQSVRDRSHITYLWSQAGNTVKYRR